MLRRGGTLAGALALAALLGLPPDPGPDLGINRLWSWIWSAVTASSCDDGWSIDPNGCPRSQGDDGQPAPKTDDGLHIDPNG